MKNKFVALFLLAAMVLIQYSCEKCTPKKIMGYEKDVINFKVQIGAFGEPKEGNDAFFEGVDLSLPILEEWLIGQTDTTYRYLVGEYTAYADAETEQLNLETTYSGAFVVAYANGNEERLGEADDDFLTEYNKECEED